MLPSGSETSSPQDTLRRGMLMSDQLSMFDLTTCGPIVDRNVISLPALGDGALRSGLPDGLTPAPDLDPGTGLFGRAVVHVSRSALWPTPDASAGNLTDTTWQERRERAARQHGNNGFGMTLGQASSLASWPTPRSNDSPNVSQEELNRIARGERTATSTGNSRLELTAALACTLASWATPTSRDHKDGASTLENTPVNGLLGRQVTGYLAQTEKRGQLNPAHSRWLQGFPKEWDVAAIEAGRSIQTIRRKVE